MGNGKIALVTELCEGGNLFMWLARIREEAKRNRVGLGRGFGLAWEDVARIGGMIASGLFYLHEEGFTFGDLKSLNVLLTDSAMGEGGYNGAVGRGVRVKLCDFGLSRRLVRGGNGGRKDDDMFTVVGKGPVGTLAYLAPEAFGGQVRNAERAKAVDIYALGIVLYELCTQLGPWIWEGIRMDQLEELVLREGRRPSWPKDRDVPERLKEFVERCWQQDPQRRPKIKEIVMELDQMQKVFAAEKQVENTELDEVCQKVLQQQHTNRHESIDWEGDGEEEITSLTESIENDALASTFGMDRFTEDMPTLHSSVSGSSGDVENKIAQMFESSFSGSTAQKALNSGKVPLRLKPRSTGKSYPSRNDRESSPINKPTLPCIRSTSRGLTSSSSEHLRNASDDEMRRISSDVTTDGTTTGVDDASQQHEENSSMHSAIRSERPLSVQDVEAELADFESLELNSINLHTVGVKLKTQEEWSALGCR